MEELDGSQGEGGGQVLRASLALCHILSKPLKIINIRAGRPKPGLANQHLEGILLLAQLSGGKIENGSLGSTSISYIPSTRPLLNRYVANPNTAGSITLMIQISLPAITLSIKENEKTILELHGGTNVSTSPSIDHVNHILLPLLNVHFGINASLNLTQRGYYPKGGGIVNMEIQSNSNSHSIDLSLINRGTVKSICGSIFGNVSFEKKKELEIAINAAIRTLLLNRTSTFDKYEDISINISIGSEHSLTLPSEDTKVVDTSANDSIKSKDTNNTRGICFQWKKGQCNRGSSCKFSHTMNNNNQSFKRKERLTIGIFIYAITDTGCYLFVDDLVTDTDPIINIDKLISTFGELLDSGCCCDEKTADQLILFMAVSIMQSNDEKKELSMLVEPSNSNSSLHLETSISIASKFTNTIFTITKQENNCRLIKCHK
jgi:RNA 3'-phosphate cyclase